jgi:methylated-DNA-[protein]-cysteine S-methyltransferase
VTPRSPALVTTVPAPWGPIHAAATERGIAAVAMLAPREAFLADLARVHEPVARAADAPAAARAHRAAFEAAFAAYLAGAPGALDELPLDLSVGSAWDRLVLDGVRTIRAGRVASYGEVAARIGRFGAARAVGGAVGRNPIAVLIPCHRVIAAGGRIGGYGGDWYGSREERLALKRSLLALEGVVLRDDPRGGAAPT